MRTSSNSSPRAMTAALRIGGAAALAFTAMIGVSALVGPIQHQSSGQHQSAGAERLDLTPSNSATASPELLVAGEHSR